MFRSKGALIISQWFGSLVLVVAGFKFGFEVLVLNLFVWGMCGGVAMTMSRTIMQEHAPADQRARMMALRTVVHGGRTTWRTIIRLFGHVVWPTRCAV